MEVELREIFSDEETENAKDEIREKITDLFKDAKSIEEKRDLFWNEIVEPGWSPKTVVGLIEREGKYSELICQFESQLMEDVMKSLGYDVTDGFC